MRKPVHSRDDLFAALHALRITSGLTQQEVADQLGVRQQEISRWEGALPRTVPRMPKLLRLLNVYGHELVIRRKS